MNTDEQKRRDVDTAMKIVRTIAKGKHWYNRYERRAMPRRAGDGRFRKEWPINVTRKGLRKP